MAPLHDKPNTCPLCGITANKVALGETTKITCSQCGQYKMTDDFLAFTGLNDNYVTRKRGGGDDPEDIVVPLYELQAIIYELNLNNIEPHISWGQVEGAQTLKQLVNSINIPKTPIEKIDRLLENLATESKNQIGIALSVSNPNQTRLAYARDQRELWFLLDNAISVNYLESISISATGVYKLKIALKGWERIEEIKGANVHAKQGFIAHWFGLANEYIGAIETGVTRAGFKPLTLRDANFPETILSKALGEINRSRFVVVDLTEQRPSVFVEAGYSMGRGIQTILVINREYWEAHQSDLEFYVKNYNIKKYSSAVELEEIVERAIRERIF